MAKNKFGNCADIDEEGRIKINCTLPSDDMSSGRLTLQIIDTPDDMSISRYAYWCMEIKKIPYGITFNKFKNL